MLATHQYYLITLSFQCSLSVPENVRKPLVKQEKNLWFSGVFRGIKREHWEEMGYYVCERSSKLSQSIQE